MITIHRDNSIEKTLQKCLDDQNSVWAVGDIHGCNETFNSLIELMNLHQDDKIICLGDLVDRGPNSHGVLETVFNNKNIYSLKGNHEQIMDEALTGDNQALTHLWLNKLGGSQTLESMPGLKTEKLEKAKKWLKFTRTFPSEIVLKKYRLVHAGFREDIPINRNTERDRLRSRRIFLSDTPLDSKRQIIVGHTPVQLLNDYGLDSPNQGIWKSQILLSDGRHAIKMIDTGVILAGRNKNPKLTAINLLSGKIIQISRIEQYKEDVKI